jgi:hypothetical protein
MVEIISGILVLDGHSVAGGVICKCNDPVAFLCPAHGKKFTEEEQKRLRKEYDDYFEKLPNATM